VRAVQVWAVGLLVAEVIVVVMLVPQAAQRVPESAVVVAQGWTHCSRRSQLSRSTTMW